MCYQLLFGGGEFKLVAQTMLSISSFRHQYTEVKEELIESLGYPGIGIIFPDNYADN